MEAWRGDKGEHKAKQIPSMPWRWRLRRGLALNKDDHDDDDDDDVKSSPKNQEKTKKDLTHKKRKFVVAVVEILLLG